MLSAYIIMPTVSLWYLLPKTETLNVRLTATTLVISTFEKTKTQERQALMKHMYRRTSLRHLKKSRKTAIYAPRPRRKLSKHLCLPQMPIKIPHGCVLTLNTVNQQKHNLPLSKPIGLQVASISLQSPKKNPTGLQLLN